MLRELIESDRKIAIDYLDKNAFQNIHMIHKLQTSNLDDQCLSFFGEFSGDHLQGILMLEDKHGKLTGRLSGKNQHVLSHLAEIAYINGARRLVGEKSIIEVAISSLKPGVIIDIKGLNMVKIKPEQFVKHYDYSVRNVIEQDIPLLVKLYTGYEGKRKGRSDEEIKHEIQNIMNASGKYFMVEMDGHAVCASRIYHETDKAGVIGSSRTLPEYRGSEIYLSVRTACMDYLFEQGKIGIGFIKESNRSIKRIIDKQGGSITAKWLVVNLRKKKCLHDIIFPRRIRKWAFNMKETKL